MSMRCPGGGSGTNMFQDGVFARIYSQLNTESQQILDLLALPRAGPQRSSLSIGTYICYSRRLTPFITIFSFFLYLVYLIVYYTTEPGGSFWTGG